MVTFDRVYIPLSKIGLRTIIEPDLVLNMTHGIKSDFTCCVCDEDLGIGWKQGPKDGMIVRCPNCGIYNEFIRREV